MALQTEQQERKSYSLSGTPETGAHFELAIEGMTCASCVRRVERALTKVEGVQEVSVNLATEEAQVQGTAPLPSLMAAVERAGYRASPVEHEDATRGGLEARGETVMLVTVDGSVAGAIGVADTVKDGSVEAVRQLHDLGIELTMLTGDNPRAARTIGDEVGIDRVVAEVRPDDKVAEVRRLQGQGRVVAMALSSITVVSNSLRLRGTGQATLIAAGVFLLALVLVSFGVALALKG